MCYRSPALSLLAIAILTPQINCRGASKTEETSTTSDASSSSASASETSFPTPSTSHTTTSPTSIDTLSTDTNNTSESASSTANTTSDPSESDCSLAKQDCPDGKKCSAFGKSYDQTRCVPVSGNKKPGEECTVVPGYTGEDDCETGAVCLRVNLIDPAVCFDMCSTIDPLCENGENFDCFAAVGIVNICVPSCDPLKNDCDTEFICAPEGQIFWCVPGAGNVPPFGACPNGNECGAGLICASPIGAIECDPDVSGCCLPFCDLNGPEDACPGMGQLCVSIYPPDDIPSKYSHVGICTI